MNAGLLFARMNAVPRLKPLESGSIEGQMSCKNDIVEGTEPAQRLRRGKGRCNSPSENSIKKMRQEVSNKNPPSLPR